MSFGQQKCPFLKDKMLRLLLPRRHSVVVSSPPAEIGAMGREIESR
jgi:hypothetical protein